jgi:arylformamidase
MNYSEIIDISLSLSESTIVYPGNPKVELEAMPSATSGSVISKIVFGSHTGTHVDAPQHVIENGEPLDQISLETFVGNCRVIDCTSDTESVSRKTLENANVQKNERILLKTTNSLRGFEKFYDDYVFVSPEATSYLAEKEVSLVAIDYLSIKQRGSKDNSPHTNLLSRNIPIIEGVDLSKVQAGEYFLVLLPLKFINIDGAPARAILMK